MSVLFKFKIKLHAPHFQDGEKFIARDLAAVFINSISCAKAFILVAHDNSIK